MNIKIKRKQYILACTMLIISAGINVYFAFVLQKIIDSTASKDVTVLLKSIVFAVLFMVFDMIATIIAKYFSGKYVQGVLQEIKNRKFSYILNFFTRKSSDSDDTTLSSFTTDIDIVENDYLRQKLLIVFYSAQFILGLIAIISISLVLTLSIAVVTVIPIIIPKLFEKIVQSRKEQYSKKSSKYIDYVNESIAGRNEIKDYDKTEFFFNEHDKVNHKVEEARFKSRFFDSVVETVSQNLGFLTFITALGVGSYYVIKGQMTFGYMIAVVQLMNNLLQPLNYITYAMNQINSSKNIVKQYDEDKNPIDNKEKTIQAYEKDIKISNLYYSYYDENPVVDNLSLTFRKGKKYAIIGPSGCGKSTLAKILSKDIEEYEGTIEIDGINIKELDQKTYRKVVHYVRQDSFIFKDTIRNNILFYDDSFSKLQLQDAIRSAKLNDFIKEDDDLNKKVSSTEGLSGGQKQRISLARALIRNIPVLILDEITSSVDPNTTYDIYKDLVSNHNGTCIVITHQQDERILGLFDEVIEFEGVTQRKEA